MYGKIISNELNPKHLTVINLATKESVVTDGRANFVITARINDTLRFEGQEIEELSYVLQPNDFKEELFVMRVIPKATMLKEVIISGLTGDLEADSKKIKIKPIGSQFDAAVINRYVVKSPGFIGLFNLLFKKRPKVKRAKSATFVPEKLFLLTVRDRYNDAYFVDTLSIPSDEIMSFLYYCSDGDVSYLLDPNNEFKLLQYLNSKSLEYLKKDR
ncbi:MAG: hypothetical protein BM557_00765 [Flavobacterium sp. MedPE-SWcel]|nr:MAG: hypothetical protein BM557_00765 [Flavobacterium sp. MedPE-SWcel]